MGDYSMISLKFFDIYDFAMAIKVFFPEKLQQFTNPDRVGDSASCQIT